ncbi:protein FRIGIDA [Coffea eugenioides]|uniref:protein FRIGIDA n=1 Tax=Coffea eugenioides TaxID=49369 RepID=UPI000F605F64|nr:protein FRIGIDA [Coffea eugenioides]
MAQPAVTAPMLPPIKAEHDPNPPPPQPETTTPINQEPQPTTTTTSPPSRPPQTPSSPPFVPSFLNSITYLRDLSAALETFHSCYYDLQAHLDSINSALDSQLSLQKSNLSSPPREILPIIPLPPPTSTRPPSNPSPVKEKEKGKGKSCQSELESLCTLMSSRGLRKYMVTNIGEPDKLREEVPKALELSPNPAKLVLECSGRFFLQGSKAYTKDSPMIPAREASVLVLECFLLMENEGGDDRVIKIEKAIKEEAAEAAMAWRKRLINEGGLAKASEIDARGLLFFLGCFGIPAGFRNDDFRDLVRAGNVKEIAGVLKRSSVLVTKFSDIIGWMVKNKMAVDAVDVACTFGFEDKFNPQTILTSFLRESKETSKKTKSSTQGSLAALNEAKKKQLSALTSVVKCLESHKIDPSKLLPGWQINEKIKSLEKDIADSDKHIREKAVPKRKADQTDSSNLKSQEVKRSRYTGQGPQQQKVHIHIDSERNILDGVHGHINRSYALPSALHGAGARLLPEGIACSVVGIGGDVLGAGIGGGISGSAHSVVRTGSYAGVHSGALVDAAGHIIHYDGHPYGLRGDTAVSERLAAPAYAAQPPSYGLAGLYKRTSPSLDNFPGLPSNSTVAHRSSASDLYQFADSIVESESYHSGGSRAAGAIPPVVPAHHSSYLY